MKTKVKESKIKYDTITEAEVQSVWPDLCQADKYEIAYNKVLQNLPTWKQEDIVNNANERVVKEFIKSVIEIAQSEEYYAN
tara:strand:- start:2326 stop:2568 length:243 start_codon:yes stop_codon:yes gene_type:complete